jgi:hypothetical protein
MASKLRQRKWQTAEGMMVQRHRAGAWALDGFGRAQVLMLSLKIFVAKIKARNRMSHSSIAVPRKYI